VLPLQIRLRVSCLGGHHASLAITALQTAAHPRQAGYSGWGSSRTNEAP